VLGAEGEFLGFDVVVGNPPYIGHDFIVEKDFFKSKYESYNSFTDLYCLFIEQASQLIQAEGVLSFIVSNSFLRSDYGKSLRSYMHQNTSILELFDLNETKVFEDAVVNAAIVSLTRNKRKEFNAKIINDSLDKEESFSQFVASNCYTYDQQDFAIESWGLLRQNELKVLLKLIRSGSSLENLNTKIRLGIATGSNDAFIVSSEKTAELIATDPKSLEIIKPILRGKEIERYSYSKSGDNIILLKNGINGEDYPAVIQHLESFGKSFKKRGARGIKWYNLRAATFYEDFKSEYITWIELSNTNRFTLVSDEVYLLNSAYFLKAPEVIPSTFLLGVLNSRAVMYFIKSIAATSGVGTIRWFNTYVKQIPIPDGNSKYHLPISSLATQILTQKQSDPTADTTSLEAEIDVLVYKLYGLTYAEVLVVDGAFGLSEEEYNVSALPG
jgi:hypothetical protein